MTGTGRSSNLPMPSWAMCGAPSVWWNSLASWPSTPPPRCPKPVAMTPCSKPRIASLITMPSLPPDVLQSHIEATYHRLEQVPLVLAVQDTTEVDWTAHSATKHLGPLGHTACQGLLVHSTLAFTPERVPVGLLAQQVWARDPDDVGKRTRRKQLPISQKESQKWLTSLEAVLSAHDECPQTRFVSIGDREADVYDLLTAARPAGVELLIRAAWDRCVRGPERYVWATVEAQPVVEQLLLQVPRRGAQPARDATLALRFCRLT